MRPQLLDLYCCAGGAATGYFNAGFEVFGVDVEEQPRYPFWFHRGNALDVLRRLDNSQRVVFKKTTAGLVESVSLCAADFAVRHASPPCQAYSPLNALPSTRDASEHPDLVAPTRDLLNASSTPWVIENVMSAPLMGGIRLCGGMFGLRTYRHRRFEFSGDLALTEPPHPPHVIRTATKRRRERWAEGWHISVTGDIGTYLGPEAMGIDWMNGHELCEAIPPAYTEFIGIQLLEHLADQAAA